MFHHRYGKEDISKYLQTQRKENISFHAILFALEDHFNIKQYNRRKQPLNKPKKTNKEGFKSLGKRSQKIVNNLNIFDSILSNK